MAFCRLRLHVCDLNAARLRRPEVLQTNVSSASARSMLVQIACSLQKNLENENRQRTENRRARPTSAGRRKVRPTSAGCALIMYRYSKYCSCRCCCASVFQSQRTPLDCRSHWDHSPKRPLCHSNADLVISATSSPATSGLSSKTRQVSGTQPTIRPNIHAFGLWLPAPEP
jgi:hypothetical protein